MKKGFFIFILNILICISVSISAFASPRISWFYKDHTQQGQGCRTECSRRVFRGCVSYRKVCDYRTRFLASWSGYKSITKDAMNYLSQNVGTSKFRSCVLERSEYAPGGWNRAKRDIITLGNVSRWPEINLHARVDGGGAAGRVFDISRVAYSTSRGLSWKGRINMMLFQDNINQNRRKYGYRIARNFLAGTILHELLHQMGHTHPKSYYDGNFITVAGDCIAMESN